MSERVCQILNLFDALPEPDKQSALFEMLRRNPPGEPDLPAYAHDALADELFSALDAME